jgi:molecular chaperone GrpE
VSESEAEKREEPRDDERERTEQKRRDKTTDQEPEQPVIRDRRRLDPVTGQVRQPQTPGAPPLGSAGAADGQSTRDMPRDPFDAALEAELAGAESLTLELDQARRDATERLEDLRRLQAEYVNYRRRVERDREAVRDTAVANALAELLPILDDIGRAREHGDLTGPFKAVGEALEQAVAKLGLVKFGEEGDRFDPTQHEALMHEYSDEVEEPTCVRILMPGYRFGERIVRPARVAVAEPTVALPQEAENTNES